jgi:hypothetical protein
MQRANASKLADLILARLSVRSKRPPALSAVSSSLQKMLARQLTASEWKAAFQSALVALRDAGLVERSQLVLTRAGQQRVRAVLRLSAPPRAKTWQELRSRYLPRLFFDAPLPEGAKVDPALVLLAERLGVPLEAKATATKLVKTWLARTLELPSKTSEAVTNALTARWLLDEARAAAPTSNAARSAKPTLPVVHDTSERALQRVVAKVLRVSAGSGLRHYGPNKVFIASVWEALASDAEIAALGEPGFKQLLAEAHRRGLLVLSRADLVAAMDPRDVAASETRHHNATYHFIQRGASA